MVHAKRIRGTAGEHAKWIGGTAGEKVIGGTAGESDSQCRIDFR